MIVDVGSSELEFWVEVVHTKNYVKNLPPRSILGGKTLEEA
jgi:hypothetical protein